jgi:hypothetical protein
LACGDAAFQQDHCAVRAYGDGARFFRENLVVVPAHEDHDRRFQYDALAPALGVIPAVRWGMLIHVRKTRLLQSTANRRYRHSVLNRNGDDRLNGEFDARSGAAYYLAGFLGEDKVFRGGAQRHFFDATRGDFKIVDSFHPDGRAQKVFPEDVVRRESHGKNLPFLKGFSVAF